MALVTNKISGGPVQTVALNKKQPGERVRSYTNIQFDRPANATGYTAGDVISDDAAVAKALVFPDAARWDQGSGRICSASIVNEDPNANSLTLYLFNDEPTNHQDNDALALVDADWEHLVGVIPFAYAPNALSFACSTNTVCYVPGVASLGFAVPFSVDLPYTCAADSKALYGLLVAAVGYTPGNNDTIHISLGLELD